MRVSHLFPISEALLDSCSPLRRDRAGRSADDEERRTLVVPHALRLSWETRREGWWGWTVLPTASGFIVAAAARNPPRESSPAGGKGSVYRTYHFRRHAVA